MFVSSSCRVYLPNRFSNFKIIIIIIEFYSYKVGKSEFLFYERRVYYTRQFFPLKYSNTPLKQEQIYHLLLDFVLDFCIHVFLIFSKMRDITTVSKKKDLFLINNIQSSIFAQCNRHRTSLVFLTCLFVFLLQSTQSIYYAGVAFDLS